MNQDQQDLETRQWRAEIRRAISEVARNQDCLHKGFLAYKDEDEAWKSKYKEEDKKWKDKFEPFLVEEIQSKADREKFFKERRRAIAARVFDSLIYGGFIAAVYTLWNYRDALKAIKDLS